MLKDHHINIVIAAGRTNPDTTITALHDGGASRISGAFSIHQEPVIMDYFGTNNFTPDAYLLTATRSVPIELGVTDLADLHTTHVKTFTHPLRLFIDNDIRGKQPYMILTNFVVTICSFDNALYKATRSQTLLKIWKECNLTSAELLKLLSIGYRRNFQRYLTQHCTECQTLLTTYDTKKESNYLTYFGRKQSKFLKKTASNISWNLTTLHQTNTNEPLNVHPLFQY
jgi:hypothetical protein